MDLVAAGRDPVHVVLVHDVDLRPGRRLRQEHVREVPVREPEVLQGLPAPVLRQLRDGLYALVVEQVGQDGADRGALGDDGDVAAPDRVLRAVEGHGEAHVVLDQVHRLVVAVVARDVDGPVQVHVVGPPQVEEPVGLLGRVHYRAGLHQALARAADLLVEDLVHELEYPDVLLVQGGLLVEGVELGGDLELGDLLGNLLDVLGVHAPEVAVVHQRLGARGLRQRGVQGGLQREHRLLVGGRGYEGRHELRQVSHRILRAGHDPEVLLGACVYGVVCGAASPQERERPLRRASGHRLVPSDDVGGQHVVSFQNVQEAVAVGYEAPAEVPQAVPAREESPDPARHHLLREQSQLVRGVELSGHRITPGRSRPGRRGRRARPAAFRGTPASCRLSRRSRRRIPLSSPLSAEARVWSRPP